MSDKAVRWTQIVFFHILNDVIKLYSANIERFLIWWLKHFFISDYKVVFLMFWIWFFANNHIQNWLNSYIWRKNSRQWTDHKKSVLTLLPWERFYYWWWRVSHYVSRQPKHNSIPLPLPQHATRWRYWIWGLDQAEPASESEISVQEVSTGYPGIRRYG